MRTSPVHIIGLIFALGLYGCGKGPAEKSRPRPSRKKSVKHTEKPKPRRTKPGVRWLDWGKKAFKQAHDQDKPVLLAISTAWSIWEGKMDQGTFAEPEVLATIKRELIPIHVDGDERPDINRRYTQGPWTTAFLTPDAQPYGYLKTNESLLYGGKYYTANRIDLAIRQMVEMYQGRKREYRQDAELLAERVKFLQKYPLPPDLNGLKKIPPRIMVALRIYYDEKYGGFDEGETKLARTNAIDFLLYEYSRTQEQRLLLMVNRTLGAMAASGIYDHLGGGFHRWAAAADWRKPHFAKMCSENAEHIRNFLHAYQATGNGYYKRIAEETINYVTRVLSNRAAGGFYGSQARDDLYYTWSRQEIERILTKEEADIALRYFGVGESRNETEPQSGRYVLTADKSVQRIARELHLSANEVKERLATSIQKMRQAREERPTPRVDRRLFADWNAAMASSFLHASAILDSGALRTFALKTLDLLMAKCYRNDIGMYHCFDEPAPRISGLLADQVMMAQALLDAHVLTGDPAYLKQCRDLISIVRNEFSDKKGGGFYDRIQGQEPIGLLAVPDKPIDANTAAARCLIRLHYITGEKQYLTDATRTLGAFTRTLEGKEVAAAGYALAVQETLEAPLRLIVVGPPASSVTAALLRETVRFYEPRKIILPVDPSSDPKRAKELGLPPNASPGVYPCYRNIAGDPISNPDHVTAMLDVFVKKYLHPEE
ncbi:MAG: thioredoxin domain-containing protein [Planctomycetes bacterium]|nr:thioredoxin domain-containing protein [Planctomycetota bacterium]